MPWMFSYVGKTESTFNESTLNLAWVDKFSVINNYLQSVTKVMAKSKKIKQIWTRPGNFDICFCLSFHR